MQDELILECKIDPREEGGPSLISVVAGTVAGAIGLWLTAVAAFYILMG